MNLEEFNSGWYQKFKFVFDDWEKMFEMFQKWCEYKEVQWDVIWNEIYQVIGFYIVFQGVIFMVVVQVFVLWCYNWWMLFLLLFLILFVIIGVVFQKLLDFWVFEIIIVSEKSFVKVQIYYLQQKKNFGIVYVLFEWFIFCW